MIRRCASPNDPARRCRISPKLALTSVRRSRSFLKDGEIMSGKLDVSGVPLAARESGCRSWGKEIEKIAQSDCPQNTEGTPRVPAEALPSTQTTVGEHGQSGRPSSRRPRPCLPEAERRPRLRERACPRLTRAAIASATAQTVRSTLSPCHVPAERSRSHLDFSRPSPTDLLLLYSVFAAAQPLEQLSSSISFAYSPGQHGRARRMITSSGHQRVSSGIS